ncbi:MAG: TetR/AcrR family transcriptional regulator [Aristaeellaceae bacterium]
MLKEGEALNHPATTRAAILEKSRQLIMAQGWSAISIRTLAAACGVSVGAIYNYFPSKAELLLATVDAICTDIFRMPAEGGFDSITDCIRWAYGRMADGMARYPGFFVSHAAIFTGEERQQGRAVMLQAWQHMHDQLLRAIACDPRIRPDAFDAHLTRQGLTELIFSQLLMSLTLGPSEPDALIALVERSLY